MRIQTDAPGLQPTGSWCLPPHFGSKGTGLQLLGEVLSQTAPSSAVRRAGMLVVAGGCISKRVSSSEMRCTSALGTSACPTYRSGEQPGGYGFLERQT
jgi:hypothetical protein